MIALARKYRPRRFADLLVQDHVAASLSGAVARDRVGHGYLLAGPRGTGKTTAARILAMALNCERRGVADPGGGEPCGECPSCQRVWSGAANLDVVEIDAASNRGVDDARELRERAMYAASQEGRHKVYIVDEAHMLTREAWNALLKILEEPPPGVVFVFATTEPQKIAAAAAPVLSRLQRFDFRRIGPAAIRDRLRQVLAQEALAADEDALVLIARYADGGMRDALSVLDQCLSFGESPITAATVRRVLGLIDDERYAALLRAVATRDAAAVFPLVDELVESGADLVEFMTGAADLLRSVLISLNGAEPEGITDTLRQAIAECRTRLASSDVVRMLALLADAETAIRRSGSARIMVETLLLRWAVMDRVVELERVIAGGSVGGGAPAPPTPRGSNAPRPSGPHEPPASPRTPSSPKTDGPRELTLATLQNDWHELVLAARAQSPVLGEALSRMVPASVEQKEVRLSAAASDVFVDGLQKRLAEVDELFSAHFGVKTRVLIALEADSALRDDRPKRLTGNDLRSERLERLRGIDPALDTMANELDLEIVDDSPRSP